MKMTENKLLQPAQTPASDLPRVRSQVPWSAVITCCALVGLIALVLLGPIWWHQADALFMDALGVAAFAVRLAMSHGVMSLRRRLRLSAGLIAGFLGLAYLLLGIPPQGVALVLFLIVSGQSIHF
jgi:hypothetical protein